jgi:PIN domain nuclease of toxin-antitoxin system
MQYLLDTQAFLYITTDSPLLTPRATAFFLDPKNEPKLSVVSAWEISIKTSIGKLTLPTRAGLWLREQLALNQISLLNLELEHVGQVAELPFHHKDPFDRMLVAQGLCERLPIMSGDTAFDDYGIERIW